MTYEQREKIFSKEYICIEDMQVLLGLTYQDAAKMIRDIKRKSDRLHIRGKVHTQDYFDYFGIKAERYTAENY